MKEKSNLFKSHFLEFLKKGENLSEDEEKEVETLISEFGEMEKEVDDEIEAGKELRKQNRKKIIDAAAKGPTRSEEPDEEKTYSIEDFDEVFANLAAQEKEPK